MMPETMPLTLDWGTVVKIITIGVTTIAAFCGGVLALSKVFWIGVDKRFGDLISRFDGLDRRMGNLVIRVATGFKEHDDINRRLKALENPDKPPNPPQAP